MFNMSSFQCICTLLACFTYLIFSAQAANNVTTQIPLRIMALGASVTFGQGSTTGNSYRKSLEDLLVASNNIVQYVGTKKNGNFADNAVEATGGFVDTSKSSP